GNSIAAGKGFVDDTQPESDRFVVNAPLYAVLIAPVEALFPLSLLAIKTWTLIWGIASLVLIYRWAKPHVGDAIAAGIAAVIALNPAIVLLSTEVLSEAPFIVFAVAILMLIERAVTTERSRTTDVLLVAALSVVGLLRESGIALVFSAVIFLMLKQRQ